MQSRWLLLIVASLGALATLALLASRLIARRMVFPAPRPRTVSTPEGARLVEIDGRTGRTVYAIEAPCPNARAPVVVWFHGNAEQLADQTEHVRALHARGLSVLAVEYPGYGPATRYAPSEQAIYEDAQAAIRWLQQARDIESRRIVLLGRSLGTGVAVEMASRDLSAGVVLISAYTSIPAVGRSIMPRVVPVERFVEDRFDSLSKAKSVRVPVLLIHGEADALIPIAMGETLSRSFADATLWRLEGVDHNDVYDFDPDALYDRITRFAIDCVTPEESL